MRRLLATFCLLPGFAASLARSREALLARLHPMLRAAVFGMLVMAIFVTRAEAAGSSGPQCNLPNLATALGDTATTVLSSACSSANSDPTLYLVVAALSAAIAAADGPGQQVCNDIKNILGTAQSDANKAQSVVNKIQSNFNLGDIAQQALDAIADASDVVNIASMFLRNGAGLERRCTGLWRLPSGRIVRHGPGAWHQLHLQAAAGANGEL